MICELSFGDAKKFIGKQKNLIIKESYRFYGWIENGSIVSVIGISEGKVIKTHCNFTPADYRRKGYFTKLLQSIMSLYRQRIVADCLKESSGVYLRCGFECVGVKHYKSFDIYRMEYYGEKQVENKNCKGV